MRLSLPQCVQFVKAVTHPVPTHVTLPHNRMLTEITFKIKSGAGQGVVEAA